MNYPNSQEIIEKVKSAKSILINCHVNADVDSIGSALAMAYFLETIGKSATVICPTEIDGLQGILEGVEKIKTVEFDRFEFSDYDLFIILDTASLKEVSGLPNFSWPEIELVVIDHHKTNDIDSEFKIIDSDAQATTEVLYLMFSDGGIKIDKLMANYLLSGLLSDTGGFQFPGTTSGTLRVGAELMERGADKNFLLQHLFRSVPFERVRLAGALIASAKVDFDHSFVWSAMPFEEFERLGSDLIARKYAAAVFFQIVKDTDFGIVMVEIEKGVLSVSFRARNLEFDTTLISSELGGGGHSVASGAKIEGMNFKDAVEKVLEVSRTHALGK